MLLNHVRSRVSDRKRTCTKEQNMFVIKGTKYVYQSCMFIIIVIVIFFKVCYSVDNMFILFCLPLFVLCVFTRVCVHLQVSDVNDDVRRVAVTSLGFLLFRSVPLLYTHTPSHHSPLLPLCLELPVPRMHGLVPVLDFFSKESVAA